MQLVRNEWHMQTISNKQTCALSRFYDWLICRNVRVIDSWLLLSLPAGGGSVAWWWPRPVLRGLCVTGRLVSGYSLLPFPSPLTFSGVVDHKIARTRARGGRVTGRLNALWSSCVMRPSTVDEPALMRVYWPISADTTVADTIPYDTPSIWFRYETDPIIVRSLILWLSVT